MAKTKLAQSINWIKRIKGYRNPKCGYPWKLSNTGFCWAYANYVDDKNFRLGCERCKYWKGEYP